MPVTTQWASGGRTSDGQGLNVLLAATLTLPDAFAASNLTITGYYGVPSQYPAWPAAQSLTGNLSNGSGAQTISIASLVPGSGTNYANLQLDLLNGNISLQTSATAYPAPINGHNIIICQVAVPSTATVPWALPWSWINLWAAFMGP